MTTKLNDSNFLTRMKCCIKTLTDLMTFVDNLLYISYWLSGCGLSTIIKRPAPLWVFSEFGAVYKYPDLLTYLLTYIPLQNYRRVPKALRLKQWETRCLDNVAWVKWRCIWRWKLDTVWRWNTSDMSKIINVYWTEHKTTDTVASRPLGQVGPWPDLKYTKSGQVGPDQDWSGQARFIF